MANPFVHAIVILAAIIIPGGLLVYFAWYSSNKLKDIPQKPTQPTPEEAREAFRAMYPPESLREKSRRTRLSRAKAYRRRKPEK